MFNPDNYRVDFSILPVALQRPQMLLVKKIHPVFPITLTLLMLVRTVMDETHANIYLCTCALQRI